MLGIVTNGHREDIHEHLTKDEEQKAEQDITQRPSIIQRSQDKYNLRDDIGDEKDTIDDDIKHP